MIFKLLNDDVETKNHKAKRYTFKKSKNDGGYGGYDRAKDRDNFRNHGEGVRERAYFTPKTVRPRYTSTPDKTPNINCPCIHLPIFACDLRQRSMTYPSSRAGVTIRKNFLCPAPAQINKTR